MAAIRESKKLNVSCMSFSEALIAVKQGYKISRAGWNGKGQYVAIQRPDEHSKMTNPYLYIKNAQGGLIPWLASQGDLMAEDWEVVVNF